jgi:glycosyltransferase involved in cell wall biosynthesis
VAVQRYVLTTPAFNEMDNLPAQLADLEAQELRPSLWVVVDDGSDDGTLEWLTEQAKDRDWMEVRQSPERTGEYLGGHIARIKRWGLEQVIALARERGIEPDAAGVLDADIGLPPEHYRKILEAFAADPKLGVASSTLQAAGSDGTHNERLQREDLPRGPTQTFRMTCLDEMGGLPPWPGFDGAANVKAKLLGWKTKMLTDVVATHERLTATRFGVAKGYRRKGRYAYFLGHHPVLLVGRAAAYTLQTPHTGGMYFLRGWLGCKARGEDRCPDMDVWNYYRNERVREYLRRGAPKFVK